MSDPEKKICRYFNTLGGCWYGDSCKFLHIPNKKPPCKFFGSSTGCRYGESCHFSHDRTPFKSVENYSNPPMDLMKEVFKENMDPSELSGTNNNNMTQPVPALTSSGQQQQQQQQQQQPVTTTLTTDMNMTDLPKQPTNLTNGKESQIVVQTPSESINTAIRTETETVDPFNLTSVTASQTITTATSESITPNLLTSTVSIQLEPTQAVTVKPNTTPQEVPLRESAGMCLTRVEEGQNYALTPINSRSNTVTNEIEICCGSCKRVLERRGNESYCTLLKDHYLECFLDKEGDHVKYVKTKAALEPGQMYWCKSCILIFEKPWSLFQHMADKAKGSKVQRWEKKIHLDWMDSVAGLMAGYDLGLFSPAKLRIDLRNLLADQHTMEEEMEAAAVTAAAMMQWLAPLSSPWRLQQREMMRKIEQLNRQMLRKANIGLNANGGGYPLRAALTAAPTSVVTSPTLNYAVTGRTNTGSLPVTPAPPRIGETVTDGAMVNTSEGQPERSTRNSPIKSPTITTPIEEMPAPSLTADSPGTEVQEVKRRDSNTVGPLGDSSALTTSSVDADEISTEPQDRTGASGDGLRRSDEMNLSKNPVESLESCEPDEVIPDAIGTNNTNSSNLPLSASARGDDVGRRVEFKRGIATAPPQHNYGMTKPNNYASGLGGKGYSDSARYQVHTRGSRTPNYGHPTAPFSGAHRTLHRANRLNSTSALPPSRAANSFNPPSFHASLDFNCGFTDDEVEELLSQGIKPWDSEAAAALAVLRGELDHLLD
ncbi:unnamed protein product [Calicophoron daubneyi]|uniref:RING-type E3 ubiquitin transferase n=1 Tax=Calicophoron daubneyi TaxID=300641 RepID=A0AAV2T072_CALDB